MWKDICGFDVITSPRLIPVYVVVSSLSLFLALESTKPLLYKFSRTGQSTLWINASAVFVQFYYPHTALSLSFNSHLMHFTSSIHFIQIIFCLKMLNVRGKMYHSRSYSGQQINECHWNAIKVAKMCFSDLTLTPFGFLSSTCCY